jgi:hypothetical protein
MAARAEGHKGYFPEIDVIRLHQWKNSGYRAMLVEAQTGVHERLD